MIRKWNRIKKENLEYLFDQGCDLGEYEGQIFLIVQSWDEVEKFPQYFRDADNWGFSDEFAICDNCNQVIRTSPDSYSWTPDYYKSEFELICGDCARSHLDEAIENIQDKIDQGRQPRSLEWVFDLDDTWVKIPAGENSWDQWENGIYGGQIDDPLKQGQLIRSIKMENQPIFQVVFRIFPGQFDVSWDTYFRVDPSLDVTLTESTMEDYKRFFSNKFQGSDCHTNYDMAVLMEQALKSIPPLGSGAHFNSINVNTETGEIDIESTNDLDEYIERSKK